MAEGLSGTIVSGYDLRLLADLAAADPEHAALPPDRISLYRAMLARASGPDGQPLEGATFGRARPGKDDGRDPATDTDEEQHEDERRLEPHREARQGLRRKRPWQCLFGALHPSRVCSSTWGIHRVGAHIGGSVRFGCPHSHHPEVPGSAVLGKGGAYAGSRC